MITDFAALRKFVSTLHTDNMSSMKAPERMQYAQTMAIIQIAQELNEIKHFLSLIGPQIDKIANQITSGELNIIERPSGERPK